MLCLLAASAFAFLYDVEILNKDKIAQLSDERLMDTYIDVLVEVEALKAFYAKGGFTPKEFQSFKDILRYRVLLILEMQKRKMDIPHIPE